MKNKNVKQGMEVVMKENYGSLIKGEKYKVIRKKSEEYKFYILDHDGVNSYLAPHCKQFKKSEQNLTNDNKQINS